MRQHADGDFVQARRFNPNLFSIAVPCATLAALAVWAVLIKLKYERELEDLKSPSPHDRALDEALAQLRSQQGFAQSRK